MTERPKTASESGAQATPRAPSQPLAPLGIAARDCIGLNPSAGRPLILPARRSTQAFRRPQSPDFGGD
jgi:hypothetical protein